MYVCEVCACVVPPNTPLHRIVVEARLVEHPHRPKIYWHPPKDGEKGKWVDDPGGSGEQIVRELRVCPRCAREHAAKKTY